MRLLPPGYEDEQQRTTRYPMLYLLDGGAPGQDFFHIAGLVHQASRAAFAPLPETPK